MPAIPFGTESDTLWFLGESNFKKNGNCEPGQTTTLYKENAKFTFW
jgi:hypothetical protein